MVGRCVKRDFSVSRSVSIFELLDTQTQNGHLIDTQTHGHTDKKWTQSLTTTQEQDPVTNQELGSNRTIIMRCCSSQKDHILLFHVDHKIPFILDTEIVPKLPFPL